jgi:hypothetical protein
MIVEIDDAVQGQVARIVLTIPGWSIRAVQPRIFIFAQD